MFLRIGLKCGLRGNGFWKISTSGPLAARILYLARSKSEAAQPRLDVVHFSSKGSLLPSPLSTDVSPQLM
jgi:hypothetical protein